MKMDIFFIASTGSFSNFIVEIQIIKLLNIYNLNLDNKNIYIKIFTSVNLYDAFFEVILYIRVYLSKYAFKNFENLATDKINDIYAFTNY